VLEVLRLLVVVFFAGAGYSIGSGVGPDHPVLGALNGTAVGVVLGSGFGYVLGGVLGRHTARSAETARIRLRTVSADTLIAGALGLVVGVLVGAGVAWPVFFLPQAYLAFPLFGFVVVVLGYFGFVVGASKRDGVLALLGDRAGIAPRAVPAVALPRVLDSSVAIDARIVDVVRAGFLHGQLLVPTPVLAELQGLADAGDDLRRTKGRRGLEVLDQLQREPGVDVEVLELDVPGVAEVDAKLVRICLDRGCALLTLDTNLAKAAALAGVQVLNLHALALALRPRRRPGAAPEGGQGGRPGGRLPRRRQHGRRRAGPAAGRQRSARAGHVRAHHRQRPARLRPAGRRRGRAGGHPAPAAPAGRRSRTQPGRDAAPPILLTGTCPPVAPGRDRLWG
jgi:uncharacterized protein YacL